MFKKTMIAGVMAASAVVAVAAPGSAASAATGDGPGGGTAGMHRLDDGRRSAGPVHKAALAAGELNFGLDGVACQSFGGLFGAGYVGARGIMQEIGATNVTNMRIVVTPQAKYTTAPFWRNVPGTAKAFNYNFAGDANVTSHQLIGPARDLVWSYNFDADDDFNNYLYRMNVKFVWSNPTSVVTKVLNTAQCFSN